MSESWKFSLSADRKDLDAAMAACTHLGIGAHPDDLEVMAGHGILECLNSETQHFFGVTCTTGAGSARSGAYKNKTDAEIVELRRQEQFESARLGQYAGVLMLGYASSDLKTQWNQQLIEDFLDILKKTQPKVIYCHNLFDKHLTHVSVVSHVIESLRRLQWQPEAFYGCEVWRGLDWLPDSEKTVLPIKDVSLIKKLISCHRSQTESGKDYAAATAGRMAANATFFEARDLDENQHQLFALDLMPLLINPGLSLQEFGRQKAEMLQKNIEVNLTPFSRGE